MGAPVAGATTCSGLLIVCPWPSSNQWSVQKGVDGKWLKRWPSLSSIPRVSRTIAQKMQPASD